MHKKETERNQSLFLPSGSFSEHLYAVFSESLFTVLLYFLFCALNHLCIFAFCITILTSASISVIGSDSLAVFICVQAVALHNTINKKPIIAIFFFIFIPPENYKQVYMFISQYYKQQMENLSVGSGKEFVKFETAQLVCLYFNCMYNSKICQVL